MSTRYRPMPTGRIVGDMVGDGIASSPVPVKPPIPPLLPDNTGRWGENGNPDVTTRCPTCTANRNRETRVLALTSGICPWCDTPVAGVALEAVQKKLRDQQARRERDTERQRQRRQRARDKALAAPPAPIAGRRYRWGAQTTVDRIGQALSEHGPMTRGELEESTGATTAALTTALRLLRAGGYVEWTSEIRATASCPAPVYAISGDVQWWQDRSEAAA